MQKYIRFDSRHPNSNEIALAEKLNINRFRGLAAHPDPSNIWRSLIILFQGECRNIIVAREDQWPSLILLMDPEKQKWFKEDMDQLIREYEKRTEHWSGVFLPDIRC